MTEGPPASPADATELKLRGLERLRTAGMVGEAEYDRMRAKLLAGAPAAAAPEPERPSGRRSGPRAPDYISPALPAAPPAASSAPPSPPAPIVAPPPPVAPAPLQAPARPAAPPPMPLPAFVLAPAPPAAAGGAAPSGSAGLETTQVPAPASSPPPEEPSPADRVPSRAAWAPTAVEPPPAPAPPAPTIAPADVAPWPPVAPPAPPPARNRNAVVAVVAIVAVVAAGALAYIAHGRGASSNTTAGTGSAATSASGSGSGSPTAAARTYATLDAFVPDAKAFVEQHRGLAWQQPVTVVGLDDAAFNAKFADGQPVSPTGALEDELTVRVFRALHVVPQTFDYHTLLGPASVSGVEGFYDFKTKELYVRGTKPAPYTREVVVHELTHALQDQWYGLGKLFQRNDIGGESVEAFLAVVEGDASRIEREYRDSLPPDEQAQAAAAANGTPQQQQDLKSVPTAFLTLGAFPYGAGLQFDQALMAKRGQSTLDAAFRSPPITTAEILDPQRYLDDVQPLEVPPPEPGGTVLTLGSLGALGFVLVFNSIAGMSQAQSVLAADAWGGDTFVAYAAGARTCVRDTVVA
ncbi:MAG TPA: hypothetical protein VFO60_03505, partial [Candidatus Dormibacteraeota bacterium]|nr:hypothetical protein [Candidatus Dormibacteraeota bacterium]